MTAVTARGGADIAAMIGTPPKPPAVPGRELFVSFISDTNQAAVENLLRTMGLAMNQNVTAITLLLNCPGGGSHQGYAAYTFLRSLPVRLTTVNSSFAGSTGLSLFLAGERRLAVPHAMFGLHPSVMPMSHKPAWTAAELRAHADHVDADTRRSMAIVEERCRFPSRAALEAAFEGEVLRDTGFALEHGLCHEVRDVQIPTGAAIATVGGAR